MEGSVFFLWGWVFAELSRPIFWLWEGLVFWFGLFFYLRWDGEAAFFLVGYVGWVGWDGMGRLFFCGFIVRGPFSILRQCLFYLHFST